MRRSLDDLDLDNSRRLVPTRLSPFSLTFSCCWLTLVGDNTQEGDYLQMAPKSKVRVVILNIVFFTCSGLYLLPDSTFTMLIIDTSFIISSRISRFTWTIFAALLVTWPLLLYYIGRILASRLEKQSRVNTALFFFVLLVSPYLVWYLGRESLGPWFLVWLGQPRGIGVWLGFDALALLFKSQAILITFIVTMLGPYRNVLFPGVFIGIIVTLLLLPPYLLAIAVLLGVANILWVLLSSKWRWFLLVLPIAVGRSEVVQGLWPWGAVGLSTLFLVSAGIVKISGAPLSKPVQEQQETAQPNPPPPRSIPLVDLVEPEPIRPPEPLQGSAHSDVEWTTVEPEPIRPPEPLQPKPSAKQVPVTEEQATQEMLLHLQSALTAHNSIVRCQAINVLGQIGMSEHIEMLTQFLTPDGHTQRERLSAIEALGMIGGNDAVNALLSLAMDADLAVRWQAQEVLEILTSGKKLTPARRSVTTQETPLVRVIN